MVHGADICRVVDNHRDRFVTCGESHGVELGSGRVELQLCNLIEEQLLQL